ncbi:MAG: polysaccharide pyruvyl transferase family protein [Acidimicrobiales bacterium]
MTIALLHAYRAANRGDGWLVALSRRLVLEATGIEPTVFALDPQGVGPRARPVFADPLPVRAAATALLSATGATTGLAPIELPDADELAAAIGIGGGYLRCTDPVHEAVFRAHHLPQLRLMARLGPRSAYLPVSVGPFRRGLGRTVRRSLAATAWVAVRDDRSTRYLSGRGRPLRHPDLAACSIGVDRPGMAARADGAVGITLRALPGTNLGFDAAARLERLGLTVHYGLQSSKGRTNDDRSLYRDQGVPDEPVDFGALISGPEPPTVVVAGRLHAALAAIASGIPTIHIGYERKSVGAFTDLGLADWVVDAWTGTPEDLADRALDLATDPDRYWELLTDRFDVLASHWLRLTDRVGSLAAGAG